TSLTLVQFAGAAETLTINSAYSLPDYTKFSAAATAGTSNRAFWVAFAAGDFNEDGRKDLVVQTGDPSANGLPFGAKVFLQTSSGGFQEKAEYLLPTVGITWEFVPGDFDEDGHWDLLLEESDNDLLLLQGNGDGTFRDPVYLGLSAAGFFAVADVNGDKHLDIMAGKLSGGVGVFLGSGNGTFALKDTLATQVTPSYPRRGEIMLG